jgi:RimJ/RimL family protein N-acetyltransferase
VTVKNTFPVIESERLLLRPLTYEDLPLTLSWRNQDSIRRWFFDSGLISMEQHRAWFESYLEKEDDFVFVILEKGPSPRLIGQIALYHIDWQAMAAEFGRLMIGDICAQGKGYAKEATCVLIEHAVSQLHLREVYLEVYEHNLAAVAVYCSCGFVEAGRRNGIIQMKYRANAT